MLQLDKIVLVKLIDTTAKVLQTMTSYVVSLKV